MNEGIHPVSDGESPPAVAFDKVPTPADAKQARVAQAKAAAEQRRIHQRQLAAERKRQLPSNVAVVRHKNKVAMLTAGPGQLLLQTAGGTATYAPAAARAGRLVSGRIFFTNPDGSIEKVRAYLDEERAPSELGETHNASGSGGISDAFSSLGDDPVSMVIALVLVVVMLIALPVVIYVWLRNRRRRTLGARRVLQAAAGVPG